MDYLRIFALPYLLMCVLFSNAAHAEKFVAKAKFTLIDPVSVSAIKQSESIHIPLKKNQIGSCNIDPEDGSLSGEICHDSDSTSAQIELGGNQHQAVTVNVNQVDSNETISFSPQLFNGSNSSSNFQLNSKTHSIYVGGQVNLTHSQASSHASQLYDVEVLYP